MGGEVSGPIPYDGIVKAWIQFIGTGAISIVGSYNVDTIVDNADGDYSVNWDIDFAGVDYVVVAVCGGTVTKRFAFVQSISASSVRIHTLDEAGNKADANLIFVMAIGSQS